MIPDIILYVLAGAGVIFILLVTWIIVDEWRGTSHASLVGERPHNKCECFGENREAFTYLDNEVRGQMRNEDAFHMHRGRLRVKEPTLKGRVDMIEKHLGISVVVEPEKQSKLAIRKVKK